MSDITFKRVFFKYYDRKIADGTITFSQTGISKTDFTRLCTEPDFALEVAEVERLCILMKLTEEESKELMNSVSLL